MSAETDAWAELEALKSKRDSRRRKLDERKKERQEILSSTGSAVGVGILVSSSPVIQRITTKVDQSPSIVPGEHRETDSQVDSLPIEKELAGPEPEIENTVFRCLCEVALTLPTDSRQLLVDVNKVLLHPIQHEQIVNLLRKFEVQQLISIQEKSLDSGTSIEIISAEHTKLLDIVASLPNFRKRKGDDILCEEVDEKDEIVEEKKSDDVLSLLSLASTRERENKRIGEEILELLSRPSAKEKTLAEQFRSQGGTSVREFCPHGTKSDCRRVSANSKPCTRLHFRKIIQSHTDETLGDCSFLNTCFHMESCKYVHYKVDTEKGRTISGTSTTAPTTSSPLVKPKSSVLLSSSTSEKPAVDVSKGVTVLHAAQWLHCDLRFFDMTVLGKFAVIMADPPWDIHMELPYGTLSDDEMRKLNIPALQDEGLIFLWVTGRAMELGRECLQLWGYERVDELIWVKTNQLQRIIRTGRTGHWLNHGKEHCLVGMKGNPQINRGLDADVIVAEVRATSHKPDEIYGIIERLSPGTRKIELFGRPHNIQPNWVTLGNQLEAAHLVDEDLIKRFHDRYPDGNCMIKPK